MLWRVGALCFDLRCTVQLAVLEQLEVTSEIAGCVVTHAEGFVRLQVTQLPWLP